MLLPVCQSPQTSPSSLCSSHLNICFAHSTYFVLSGFPSNPSTMQTLEQVVIHLYSDFFPLKKRRWGSFPGYKNRTIENRRYQKKKKCSALKWDLEVLYLTQSPESRQAARVQRISKEFLCRESSAGPGTGTRLTCVVVMDLGLRSDHITHFQVWYLYPHWLSRIEWQLLLLKQPTNTCHGPKPHFYYNWNDLFGLVFSIRP